VVVPPGNLAALLGAAEALLGDAGRRAVLARRALDHAERSFDIDAIAARFEATLGRATMPKG
jgi:hypothetical protein